MGLVEAVKSGAVWLRSLVVSLSAAPPVIGTETKPANPLHMALIVLLAGGLPAALEYLSHSGYGLVLVGGVSILAYAATVIRNKLAAILGSVAGINVELSFPDQNSDKPRTSGFVWTPHRRDELSALFFHASPDRIETAAEKGDRLASLPGAQVVSAYPDRQ